MKCLFQEIVDQLIEHSTTFKDKTGFAQEKYVKKKKKKYVPCRTSHMHPHSQHALLTGLFLFKLDNS